MQLEMLDFQQQMDNVDPDIEAWNPGDKSFDWLQLDSDDI